MKANLGGIFVILSLVAAVGCGGKTQSNEEQKGLDDVPSSTTEDPVHFVPPAPWSTLSAGGGFGPDHTGIDFGIDNAPVKAVARGHVKDRQQQDCHGIYVVIEHPNGVYSEYAHPSVVADIHVGDLIHEGDVIATSGMSGGVNCGRPLTGPHLHLSMSEDWSDQNSWVNAKFFDPEAYIKNHQ